jgi:hypothetical protein
MSADIVDYLVTGLKWLAISNGVYFSAMGYLTHRYRKSTTTIESQEDLVKALEKELPYYQKKRNDIEITPVFGYEKGNGLDRIEDNKFILCADNEGTVRHELEHAFDGHYDNGDFKESKGFRKLLWLIQYLYYYEPKAVLHGCNIRV